MARTKAVLGAGARLSDYLSASLLARVYTPELVFQALVQHGGTFGVRSCNQANASMQDLINI